MVEKRELWLQENVKDENVRQLLYKLDDCRELMAYYSCAIMEIETKFKVLNTQFAIKKSYNPIETIKTRLKSMESIVGKLQRKNLPIDAATIESKLHDVAGVRVICPFISDIYMLADCLLEQDDITFVQRKDYIKNPKKNGYRSLHLIVEIPIFLQGEKRFMKVEIQFRTIAMDFWASLEHRLRYKKELDGEVASRISAELMDCAENSATLDLRMERVKNAIEGEKELS